MTETYRKDYKPLPVRVDTVDLEFVLNEESCTVTNKMVVRVRGDIGEEGLFLDGRADVSLVSIEVNGATLGKDGYRVAAEGLTLLPQSIPSNSVTFELRIVVSVKPQENTSLDGLYKSSGNYCTQCEAQGFRGITYFFDRPDVMSKYSTRIEADQSKYPVLLSNGNLVSAGELQHGRHFAVWVDPFVKPCYLFALVAGDLAVQEDHFITMSGKNVVLRIFAQKKNIHKVDHAMNSLKKAMKWDEDTFGLEYDLNLFNIVAVDDFNMGAMENKSLNIFNSRLVLATPETASDFDFTRIEGVIGHEYFHNWTGNRVTCQDWFQLTLKEGLTVYRDQEFSSDMNSRPVKRLTCVSALRSLQFKQDQSAMAHPVRPDSYQKMDNFYTTTVYNKGAEVVRMYETVLGKDGFRKGMDLYFKRHDGCAVTCDDFLAAMSDANHRDLSDLAKWYSQAGTPEVTVKSSFDVAAGSFTLTFAQSVPPTRGQPDKVPVLIPVRMSLIGQDGILLPLTLQGGEALGTEAVLWFTKKEQAFTFENVGTARPVPSLFRRFSAPVKVTIEGQTDDDLSTILRFDTDSFNRAEAGQVIGRKIVLALYHAVDYESQGVPNSLIAAFRAIVTDSSLDGAFKAHALSLPSHSELVGEIPECDPVRLHNVLKFVYLTVARSLRAEFEDQLASAPLEESAYVFNAVEVARRAIVNMSFAYLSYLKDASIEARILSRMQKATNMTDEIAMLNCLNYNCNSRPIALESFAAKWAKDALVMLKWLTIQSTAEIDDNIPAIQAAMTSSHFTITNPNCCYSLLLAFGVSNTNFHKIDGSGYEFSANNVLTLDKLNFQVSARLASDLCSFRNFDKTRQGLMRAQLQRILETEGLSANVKEVVSKSLQ